MDDLLSVDEVSALVSGLKLKNESTIVEKIAPKDDDRAQIKKQNNLDQLGPKIESPGCCSGS